MKYIRSRLENSDFDIPALCICEVVICFIDLAYGLDAHINDAEAKGGPQGKGHHDRLGDEHIDGSDRCCIYEMF